MTFHLPHTAAITLRAYHVAREQYAGYTGQHIEPDIREAVLAGWHAAHAELLIREIGSDAASRVVQQVAADAGLAVRFSVRPHPISTFWSGVRSFVRGFACGAAVVLVIWWPA